MELPESLKECIAICNSRGLTLGFAESCTGGLLSSLLASQSGVSSVYRGSIVSYSGEVKEELLGVPYSLMRTMGQVSIPVAKHMAQGARSSLACDWSVSITGVAGPDGGSEEKPVGTVCFGVCGPGYLQGELKLVEGIGRQEIQWRSALYASELLLQALKS